MFTVHWLIITANDHHNYKVLILKTFSVHITMQCPTCTIVHLMNLITRYPQPQPQFTFPNNIFNQSYESIL